MANKNTSRITLDEYLARIKHAIVETYHNGDIDKAETTEWHPTDISHHIAVAATTIGAYHDAG